MRMLDVAAGAGDQTLDIQARVGENGSVLATDLSPAIHACATANAVKSGHHNVETRVADGEDLGLDDCMFDAAVCQLSLMLFPDPGKGLRETHRVLWPGGKAVAMVCAAPDRNLCVDILVSTAMKHAGLQASAQECGRCSGSPLRLPLVKRSANAVAVAERQDIYSRVA
ncbi:MAG: class I SAM-dependent methyltransferase [Hyphomicrobiaceae bacterium]